jgi:peptidoglycan/LPS O-acetylase OafA/YrhL
MKVVDRIFAVILILGGIGHGFGSYLGYKHEPITMLWSLSVTVLTLLVAAINLLRSGRTNDRPLAWIAFAGSLACAVSAFTFGILIGNVFDPRPMVHTVAGLALAAFSLKAALSPSPNHGR